MSNNTQKLFLKTIITSSVQIEKREKMLLNSNLLLFLQCFLSFKDKCNYLIHIYSDLQKSQLGILTLSESETLHDHEEEAV